MGRLRLRWLILGTLLLLTLAGVLVVRSLLKPEHLSTFLLEQARELTGLRIELAAPAGVWLWPDLHVELRGLEVFARGAELPLLVAERAEITLPWAALAQDDRSIHGIRLLGPQLDLREVNKLVETTETVGPPAPLRLPSLEAPLVVRNGRVVADEFALEDLRIELARFQVGQEAQFDLGGELVTTQIQQRFALRLETVVQTSGAWLLLAPLRIDAVLDGQADWQPNLEGSAAWHPTAGVKLDLESRIMPWPSAWPALPFPAADPVPVTLRLDFEGATSLDGRLEFALLQGEDGLHGELDLQGLVDWLAQPDDRAFLPPAIGQVQARRMQIGPLEASGLRLELRPDPPAESTPGDPP